MTDIKAVIPAAGYGTRLFPFTLAAPKEILPVGRKPLIHLAVAEAQAAGIKEIGIVIRQGKEAIPAYFASLKARGDPAGERLRSEISAVEISFLYQTEPLGLGHALYEARGFIKDSPFVMLIPDQFLISRVTATKQLLEAAAADQDAVWSSVVEISTGEKEFFPGARPLSLANHRGDTWEVTGIQSEPGTQNNQTLPGFGRTLYPPGCLDFFGPAFINPTTGEVDLLLTFQALLTEYRNYAVLLKGKAADFGTWAGYEYFFPRFSF